MREFEINCSVCGVNLLVNEEYMGQKVLCSECNSEVLVPVVEFEPEELPAVDSVPAVGSVPAVESVVDAASVPDELFPERMKANRVIAGRVCSACNQVIDIGEDVFNCQSCGSSMHASCSEQTGGCRNPACPGSQGVTPDARSGIQEPQVDTPPQDMKCCKICGEHIKRSAKKCRYCGEFQSKVARDMKNRSKQRKSEDDSLTPVEIIFGILCGGIACIVSIIWIIQGKKKGTKLLVVALISQVIFGVIRALTSGISKGNY